MNSIVISGRLVKDIEIKQTNNGTAYTRNTIAVDRWDSKNKQTKTIFVDFVTFGHNANYLSKYNHKGSQVTILGELDSSTKESDDGKRITYWNVIATTVESAKPTGASTENKEEETSEGALPFEM